MPSCGGCSLTLAANPCQVSIPQAREMAEINAYVAARDLFVASEAYDAAREHSL